MGVHHFSVQEVSPCNWAADIHSCAQASDFLGTTGLEKMWLRHEHRQNGISLRRCRHPPFLAFLLRRILCAQLA